MNASGVAVGVLPITQAPLGAWKVVGTADVNNDGIQDILLQNSKTNAVEALIMDGSGTPKGGPVPISGSTGKWHVEAK